MCVKQLNFLQSGHTNLEFHLAVVYWVEDLDSWFTFVSLVYEIYTFIIVFSKMVICLHGGKISNVNDLIYGDV